MSLRIVIAPDSFKGTLSARKAAEAIAAGWLAVRPDDQVTLLPQADGGEGTVDAIATAEPAARRHRVPDLTGPDGRQVTAEWLELPSGTAVIDLASVCGLPLMATADALGASTRGLGELIVAVLASGATSLVIGLGGSASTDGGAGALSALGLSLTDVGGAPVPDGGGALINLATIERSGLTPPPIGGVTVLSDVSSGLLGPRGAATIFGPQKGASEADIRVLETAMVRFAHLLGGDPTERGCGAAGGTAFGFVSAWGATVASGAETIAQLTGLNQAIASADVVITGEGRVDAQSLWGKSVGHTVGLVTQQRTLRQHPGTTPQSWIIAGDIDDEFLTALNARTSDGVPPQLLSLTAIAGSIVAASADPIRWLERAGRLAAASQQSHSLIE